MKLEEFYSGDVSKRAPTIWRFLIHASEVDQRRVLVALMDYAVKAADLSEPTLLNLVETVRAGSTPDSALCDASAQAAKAIDSRYLDVFHEHDWDRSPDAPWIVPCRRHVAAEIITCGCITNMLDATAKALYMSFSFELLHCPRDLIQRVTTMAAIHELDAVEGMKST